MIMRLTSRSRYAVTAMLDLAINTKEEDTITLAVIASRHEISLSYLEQLFALLRKANLVVGVRGPGGGYKLHRSAEKITISMIIHAVNEPIDSTNCGGKADCLHDGPCIAHYLWMDLNDEVEGYFSKITLADAIAQRDEVRKMKKDNEHTLVFKQIIQNS
jgi:Rrf2 family iron-sulfur cluster assembly transcriptional regulator